MPDDRVRASAPPDAAETPALVDDASYGRLADLRAGVRRYLAWAEQRARECGLTPAQVQLALAVRAHPAPDGPTVGELADVLLLRHHSVVGLVDRAEEAGLVRRSRDEERPTRVHVQLTPEGLERLETVSALHLEWLSEHGSEMAAVWAAFDHTSR